MLSRSGENLADKIRESIMTINSIIIILDRVLSFGLTLFNFWIKKNFAMPASPAPIRIINDIADIKPSGLWAEPGRDKKKNIEKIIKENCFKYLLILLMRLSQYERFLLCLNFCTIL